MEERYKNGLELLLTLQLALDLTDDFPLKGKTKQMANLFKNEMEKELVGMYNGAYKQDPEMVTNMLSKKHRFIAQMAELNEPDMVLASEFFDIFIKNIHLCREKGSVMFTKLL